MAILQGGTYLATVTARADLTGAAITLTITAPDRTTVSPPPIDRDGVSATAAITGAQLGTYLLVWTIAGTYADVVQDQFTVEPAALDLLAITDLRDELNLADAYDLEENELRRMLRAARNVVENITGPIVPTTKTIAVDGGDPYIVLPYQWVVSITSIIEWSGSTGTPLTEQPYGASVDGYGYTWDRDTGIVHRRSYGSGTSRFAAGTRNLTIVLVAGLASIPPDIQQATARIIEHWWRKQHSAARSSSAFFGAQAGDDAGTTAVGHYEIPNAAMELLEPWRRAPGMA